VKKNKSITLFSNNYWSLYKFRYDVVQLFLSKNYNVNLIGKYDLYEKKFNNEKIKKHFVPLTERGYNFFNELRLFVNIIKIYKRISTERVIHFTIKPNIYGSLAARLFNIKYISFITGIGAIFIKKKTLLSKVVIQMYKFALKEAEEVWFTNQDDLDYFLNMEIVSKSTKVKIVPGCGVNIIEHSRSQPITQHKTILMIARIQEEKGVYEFLKLAEQHKGKHYKFILIGKNDCNDPSHIPNNIIDYHVNNKHVEYHDYRDNLEEFYSTADCLVLPTFREGLSTVLIEAANYKIPIITSYVPGCKDIIKNETYGFLCEPKNFNSLNKAFLNFLETPDAKLKTMTFKTFNHVKDNFSKKFILNFYNQLTH